MILFRDPRDMVPGRSELLAIFLTGSSKDACSEGSKILFFVRLFTLDFIELGEGALQRVRAVVPGGRERTGCHLFETEREGAVGLTGGDRGGGDGEGGGSGTAVVVDVDDGDTGHSEMVERTLTACRVAVCEVRNEARQLAGS